MDEESVRIEEGRPEMVIAFLFVAICGGIMGCSIGFILAMVIF